MLIFKIKNEIYLFEIFFNDPNLIKYFENLKDELGDAVGTVESQIIFYFICHFWYKFLLFLAKYVQYVSKNSQNFSSKLAKN